MPIWIAGPSPIGARGLGRDRQVGAILGRAREQAAERLIQALESCEAARTPAPDELRAAMRAYSGFAEAASGEWLDRRRLSRDQVRVLLVRGFLSIARDVLPAVGRVHSGTDDARQFAGRPQTSGDKARANP